MEGTSSGPAAAMGRGELKGRITVERHLLLRRHLQRQVRPAAIHLALHLALLERQHGARGQQRCGHDCCPPA